MGSDDDGDGDGDDDGDDYGEPSDLEVEDLLRSLLR